MAFNKTEKTSQEREIKDVGGAYTCDGVVILGRADEEAVGCLVVECSMAGWNKSKVDVEERQDADDDMLLVHPWDGLLAHLRRC